MCLPGTVEAVRERVDKEGVPRVSRRSLLVGGAAMAAGAALPTPIAWAGGRRHDHDHRLQDLTHVFREGFPVYTFDNPTRRTLVTVPENGFYSQEWTFGEHSGTHMDAPGHFIEDGRRSPEITPRELLAPAVVIDISRKVDDNPDAVVTVDDLRSFEHRRGRIPKGAAVFMYSGWESRVGSQEAYRNAGPDGTYHFPGFGIDALEWLLAFRRITCIGVDTLSLDFGASTTFDVHLTLLGADKYGIENLANLKRIPSRGATVFVGLIPWEEGSGGPCRVIAGW
jgi:kynurenine formamidase